MKYLIALIDLYVFFLTCSYSLLKFQYCKSLQTAVHVLLPSVLRMHLVIVIRWCSGSLFTVPLPCSITWIIVTRKKTYRMKWNTCIRLQSLCIHIFVLITLFVLFCVVLFNSKDSRRHFCSVCCNVKMWMICRII